MLVANEQTKNLGNIKTGQITSFEYLVTNNGDEDVHVSLAVSCGCTVPMLSSNPIKAHTTATVSAKFDSTGKMGLQNKVISLKYLYKNIPSLLTLTFNAQVIQ